MFIYIYFDFFVADFAVIVVIIVGFYLSFFSLFLYNVVIVKWTTCVDLMIYSLLFFYDFFFSCYISIFFSSKIEFQIIPPSICMKYTQKCNDFFFLLSFPIINIYTVCRFFCGLKYYCATKENSSFLEKHIQRKIFFYFLITTM